MKWTELTDMSKKASKGVCTSTSVLSPDPYLLLHQLPHLGRLQKTKEDNDAPPVSTWKHLNGTCLLVSCAAEV
jgi:hypothetical protein